MRWWLLRRSGRRLHDGQWQRPEVDQVHQQIQQADEHGAANHPERKIPLGAPDLTARKRRLVPSIEVAEDRHHGEPHGREQVSRRQRRRPIHRDLGRRAQAEPDQACHRDEFDRCQRSLDCRALFRTEVVHEGQDRNRGTPGELRRIRLPRPERQKEIDAITCFDEKNGTNTPR